MDHDLKDAVKFIAALLSTITFAIAGIIGGRLLYTHVVDRAACASFTAQNPDTKTFFSVSTGCQYQRKGSEYWWKL